MRERTNFAVASLRALSSNNYDGLLNSQWGSSSSWEHAAPLPRRLTEKVWEAHQNAHDQKLCMADEKSAHERLRMHASFKDYDGTPAAEELPQDGPVKS